jgi:recombination protein RecA
MAAGKKKTTEEPGTQEDSFAAAMKELETKYGAGTVIDPNKMPKRVVTSGSLLLDNALGTGGYVMGKLVELFGPNSSGKSTLALHALVSVQKAYPNDKVVYMNGEYAFDPDYAKAIGVNLDNCQVLEFTSAENMYNSLLRVVESKRVRCVIIDSHTSFQPNAVMVKEIGETTIAPHGRTNSTALGKFKGVLSRNNCLCIAIAQLRTALGSYHVSDKPTGGNAYQFYSDVRISLSKAPDIQGNLTKVTATVVKNKIANPFGKAEFDILWGTGIDRVGEVIDIAAEMGIIKKAGSWYSYKESKLGQGKETVRQFLKDNEDFYVELEEAIQGNKQEAVWEKNEIS